MCSVPFLEDTLNHSAWDSFSVANVNCRSCNLYSKASKLPRLRSCFDLIISKSSKLSHCEVFPCYQCFCPDLNVPTCASPYQHLDMTGKENSSLTSNLIQSILALSLSKRLAYVLRPQFATITLRQNFNEYCKAFVMGGNLGAYSASD